MFLYAKRNAPYDTKESFDGMKLMHTAYKAGYWRKANQIHKWFVDNVQNGNDNCGTYYVSAQDLETLKDLCLQVIKNPEKASELLPSASGFFFGPTAYDEYYIQDLHHTVKVCDKAISLVNQSNDRNGYWSLEYHSSW